MPLSIKVTCCRRGNENIQQLHRAEHEFQLSLLSENIGESEIQAAEQGTVDGNNYPTAANRLCGRYRRNNRFRSYICGWKEFGI